MSTLSLRYYPLTLSWSARQKEDASLDKAIRRVCIRMSRRKVKRVLRSLAARLEK
ncbi:MAG: hypothetical protein UX57_C0001G0025 [Candidatus Uhrbacteria bacterium GW2011_GWE2_46_68]|uniref:Uncharacterized protein n=2 Tax=Candidatus Uhriibacteriota TaxID=1752732 RepID=A0A0G1Q9S0_9BACT|nr:MAG: hypothetical protein UX45_C0002G0026 [Candidatus Uhrbacteria bacterium GW2011_GWF2_46_218]KKU41801.1 MAG: hypothetical protein UX57_C0001G0025 [Candidatus Uhrbacteria bacterium GW2011_GWE2_46_68]